MEDNVITYESEVATNAAQVDTSGVVAAEDYVTNTINAQATESYQSKGDAIKNWIDYDYDYDPRDAGTLWVAGAINDANTQKSFLEATLNEDMYSEQDIGKYYFDQNLAIARAYAREKKHETMYGYYKAAQEKAIAEGSLTGWYMPPEAHYMLGQWVTAGEELKRDDLSDADRARAESVVRATQGWFERNNISTQGIETLSRLYLLETIRHNKETERLTEEAQNIQKEANNAAAAQSDVEYQHSLFSLREAELQKGIDFDNDGSIGHGPGSKFGSFEDHKTWAYENPTQAFLLYGNKYMKQLLGEDYDKYRAEYLAFIDTRIQDNAIENNNGIINNDQFRTSDYMLSAKNNTSDDEDLKGLSSMTKEERTIKFMYSMNSNGEIEVRAYIVKKSGVMVQLTDGNYTVTNANNETKKLSELFPEVKFSTSPLVRNNKLMQVGEFINRTHNMVSVTNTKPTFMSEKEQKIIGDMERNGEGKLKHGYVSLEQANSPWVVETTKGDYVEVNGGKKENVDTKHLYQVYLNAETGKWEVYDFEGNLVDSKIDTWGEFFDGNDTRNQAINAASMQIRKLSDGNTIYVNPDGTVVRVPSSAETKTTESYKYTDTVGFDENAINLYDKGSYSTLPSTLTPDKMERDLDEDSILKKKDDEEEDK